jgi:hypothetical protein
MARVKEYKSTQRFRVVRSSERNTLCPLFCIAPERAYSTELVEASGCVYVMPEKGLNELRARQA